MFRSLFLIPVLLAAPALAQSPLPAPFTPDLSKPGPDFVAPYSPEGGVAAPVQVDKLPKGRKITAMAGGSMGVKLNVPPFDADALTRLSFDYTRSNDAKINLFFRVNGRYFAVLLFGPKQVRAGTTIIYDANIQDTRGHVEIPLRAALRSQLPGADSLKVDEVLAGNWDNSGYLLAGIGGNGPGANWSVSNFKLERPDVKPSFGAGRWEEQELVIPAKDVDALPWKNLHLQSDAGGAQPGNFFRFDARRGFVFDLPSFLRVSPPGVKPLQEGQEVAYKLLGESETVLTQGQAPFHLSSSTPAPPQLRLSVPQPTSDFFADFETASFRDAGGLDWGTSTVVERDAANPYNGGWSARIINTRLASPFDLRPSSSEINVAGRPVFTFAYRCDDRLRLDLNLAWNGQPYSIHFTDSDNPNPRLGDLGAVRDGKWHLATFDLLAALKKAKPDATAFVIQNLQFSDAGWPGNVKNLSWWLDDWKWAPATQGKLEGELALLDASGTQAVSYTLDQNSATSAETKAIGGPKLSLDLAGKTGLWWLHARAQNGAGKWSETAHYPIWCG